MKKTFFLAVIMMCMGIGMQSSMAVSQAVDPVGTWAFKAPSAPEGYGYGDIVIGKDKDAYTAAIRYGDYEIKATGVKYEKEVLTFKVYMEGEYISIKATFDAEGIKGTANYSMGDLPFTGTKKPVKK
jgi:hypothetical protein